jgi:hypothetical protein
MARRETLPLRRERKPADRSACSPVANDRVEAEEPTLDLGATAGDETQKRDAVRWNPSLA